MLSTNEVKLDNATDDHKSTLELLADANNEIEELKLQIAWLERSYE